MTSGISEGAGCTAAVADGLPGLLRGITAGTPEVLVGVAIPAVLTAADAVAAVPEKLSAAAEALA